MTGDLHDRQIFATDLAQRAGGLGMRFFRNLDKLTIESKGHQDRVSEADREVELFVRRELAAAYPDDGVAGEDHAPTAGLSGFTWVIDPIDGTANFVAGIPAWCVAIACVHDGAAVVGVIHEPSTGETFAGHKGGGAFLNGKPMQASKARTLSEGAVGIGFSNRREMPNVTSIIDRLFGECGIFYRNASGALMPAYVAAGRLLGYVEEHMNAWDCLAGMLLVEEAGGKIVRPDPETVLSEGTMVIAAGRDVFDKVHSLCAEAFDL